MALTIQNLRNAGAGTHPGDLEPGQLAFNLADSMGYLGNGTNNQTLIDGSNTGTGTASKGWIQFALKVSDISLNQAGVFLPDPNSLVGSTPPSAGQVLTYSTAANGGFGGYVPTTPGTTAVYNLANDSTNIPSPGTGQDADIIAGLTGAGEIASAGDLNAGDTVIITDSGNADRSSQVGPGTYIYNGTAFIKSPVGGGVEYLQDLLNVDSSNPPSTVAAANQSTLIVRDGSVAAETAAGAYKQISVLDLGTY